MAVEVRVPGVGESVQEGMIESWKKASGEWIERDEVLLELETDKATVEVVAETSGMVEILIEKGQVVRVGDLIARIDNTADKTRATAAPAKAAPIAASAPVQKKEEPKAAPANPAKAAPDPGPAVRRMAAEEKVDVSTIKGSGKDGRVTKGDMVATLASRSTSSDPVAPAASATSVGADEVRGTRRKPMSMLRRRIAQRLVSAQHEAAMLTTFNEVDMTEVMALRGKYKDQFQEKYGIKLGFMGFFLKAANSALQAVEAVNAYIDGDDVIYHDYCDIGVAVSTEKGLVVPVVRNVDQMTIAEVEKAIGEFADKARKNKISLDDLKGGTFTVSNGGVFGSLLSTPILNPPQSAILGMHKTQQRPVVTAEGKIEARPMMYLALSYDHRIIDGKEAVSFLIKIKEAIEDPSRMLLGV